MRLVQAPSPELIFDDILDNDYASIELVFLCDAEIVGDILRHIFFRWRGQKIRTTAILR